MIMMVSIMLIAVSLSGSVTMQPFDSLKDCNIAVSYIKGSVRTASVRATCMLMEPKEEKKGEPSKQ